MKLILLILLVFALLLIGCAEMPEKEVEQMSELKLTSPAFENNAHIPSKYSCKGDNVNPPLQIAGIPEGTKSLVLIMDDPDAPAGVWDHWIVWNIPVVDQIAEDSVPGVQGLNSAGTNDYRGPCPPSGTHSYFFKLYALDADLDLPETSKKADVEQAMQSNIIGQTQLIGLFSK